MDLLTSFPQLHILINLARQQKRKVYLVGGFLRDYVLGKSSTDMDFAVDKNALKLAKSFADKIKGAYVLLDKDHGCARVVKKANGKIVTFDFADFRAKSFVADLGLRDFTINTLSADLLKIKEKTGLSKYILDHKQAKAGLRARRVKQVSARAFEDDPLRMMRAFSLRAGLGFTIEANTLKQIKKQRETIRNVSYERIRDELFKVLAADSCGKVLVEMDKSGLLATVIPQLRIMDKCSQGGYHHLDVWPHSLEVVVQLDKLLIEFKDNADVNAYLDESLAGSRSRRELLKLGALLHDIGKPETRKKEEDGYSFHSHEHVGAGITRHIAKLLKLSVKERHLLEDMVRLHLRPGYLSNSKHPTEKAYFRYFRDTKSEAASIALLAWADMRGTRGPLTSAEDQQHHAAICQEVLHRYFAKAKEKPMVNLINGNDLIKKLKLKPSPIFGKILSTVLEAQSLGKIKSKEEALALAKTIATS